MKTNSYVVIRRYLPRGLILPIFTKKEVLADEIYIPCKDKADAWYMWCAINNRFEARKRFRLIEKASAEKIGGYATYRHSSGRHTVCTKEADGED